MSESQAAKTGKDVIYVDVDDEITGIIDKVENSKQKVVALVLPKRAASLQSTVNMKLLARSAKAAGKSPVLITSEAALMPLAGAAGLHVAKNLQTKPEVPPGPSGIAAPEAAEKPEEVDETDLPGKIDYSGTVGALAAAHEAENPETIDLDDEDEPPVKPAAAKAPKSPKVPNFDRFRLLLGLGAVALVALIVFLILAIKVLPKATITLKTTSEPVSTNFNLNASAANKEVDSDNGLIPAKLESSDQTASQQVNATGQQNNGDKASGSVVMSSQVCAPNLGNTPNDVPAGTGISSGGQNYITQEGASFSFSGGSGSCINYKSNSVDITAQAAGAKYNVSNANFSVAGRSDVSASGSASGGSDNIVTILSQSDVDAVKQKLTSGGGDQFSKDFVSKLESQGEYVLTSTLKAGDANITASPEVGQPASTANVTVKVTYSVLTVKKSDLSQIIEDKLGGQIDKTKQKLTGNFLDDANISLQSQSKPDTANLSVAVDTTAVPIINIASVKKQVEGKKAGDIKAAIGSWPGVKDVDVKLSPFWVSKAPHKDSKIKVVLQEVKDDTGKNAQP